MSRCLYSSGIKRFLSFDDDLIFGTLCDSSMAMLLRPLGKRGRAKSQ